VVVIDFRDEAAAMRAAHDALAADEFFHKTEGLLVQTLATRRGDRGFVGIRLSATPLVPPPPSVA
jgi:hypothetical protein